MNFSGMCGIQWTEAPVTGTQNAFDLYANANDDLAQVISEYTNKFNTLTEISLCCSMIFSLYHF